MTWLRGLFLLAMLAISLFSHTFLIPSGSAATYPLLAQANGPMTTNYLPLIVQPEPTPTLAVTPGATTSPTQPTATPTQLPPSFNACRTDPSASLAPNYPIRIVSIDKVAESVRLQNVSGTAIDITGWTMCSITGNQTHTGIGGSLAPGETKTFPSTDPGTIWNNFSRDDGALYSPSGSLVSYFTDL